MSCLSSPGPGIPGSALAQKVTQTAANLGRSERYGGTRASLTKVKIACLAYSPLSFAFCGQRAIRPLIRDVWFTSNKKIEDIETGLGGRGALRVAGT